MPNRAPLTTYAELADVLERLPDTITDARRARGMSTRDIAAHTGVSASCITRIETGHGTISVPNAIALLRWLDQTNGPPP